MEVNATLKLDVSLKDLALALSQDPEDFARFWFHFSEIVSKKDFSGKAAIDLEPFGKAMAPREGGIRKHPFCAIYDAMKHHERVEAREKIGTY